MRSILVDTGFWLAISNPKDKHHKKSMLWMVSNQDSAYRFVTSWVVMCESFFLIKNLVGFQKAVDLFEAYSRSEFDIIDLKQAQSARVIELMKKYKDLDIDLADITLVILAEHLNSGEILTVDFSDFSALRWNRNKHFKLLMQ